LWWRIPLENKPRAQKCLERAARTEQTEPFHRTVALKLIKAGMDTHAVAARFDSERQALALMDHLIRRMNRDFRLAVIRPESVASRSF
jgi:hypothetical protein